jgi:nucleoid-associated protein YgaU
MMPKQNDQQRLLVSQTRAYVVQKGDSLWAIGRKFGIDWRVIVRNNRIKNPSLIHPGDMLVLE